MDRYQKIMMRHGFYVILLGLLGGFGLAFNVLGEIALSPFPFRIDYQIPGDSDRWRAVHTGNIMNGLMAVVLALVVTKLQLREGARTFICFGTVFTVWGNAFFYVFSVFSPNRGLSMSSSKIGDPNWASVLAYVPAILAAITLIFVILVILKGLRGN